MPHMFPTPHLPPSMTWITFFFLLSLGMALLASSLYFFNISLMMEWPIFSLNSVQMSFPIILDPTGLTFSAAVFFISANIFIFAKFYMSNVYNTTRFTHLVIAFVFSMNMVIFFPNLVMIMIGWDGLGITSFLLVIFYHNSKSFKSGIITAFTNRLGDSFILMAITLTMAQGHWSIFFIWFTNPYFMILLILAAMTKSAQSPFSSWLPEAMAAPTPVSALVHSSTLVTAGVFLLIRFHSILPHYPHHCVFLSVTGALTCLMGSGGAMTINDPKKVVALSTMSQLGMMVAMIGMGAYQLAFFHLITHAMFKSLLFVCVGFSIMTKYHQQNFFGIYGKNYMPLMSAGIMSSLFSMNAFPFLAGYYSKDLILEQVIFNSWNFTFILIFLLVATSNTATYSIRLWRGNVIAWNPWPYSVSHRTLNTYKSNLEAVVVNLSLGSITSGAVLMWMLFPYPTEFSLSLPWHFMPTLATFHGTWFALAMCSSLKADWHPIGSLVRLKKENTHSEEIDDQLVHVQNLLFWGHKQPQKVSPLSYQLVIMTNPPTYISLPSWIIPKTKQKRKVLDKYEWEVLYQHKNSQAPAIVLFNRWMAMQMNMLNLMLLPIGKTSLVLAENIMFMLEQGWLQFYGPQLSHKTLTMMTMTTTPNTLSSFLRMSIIPLTLMLTLTLILF